jgi:hypothetical protein
MDSIYKDSRELIKTNNHFKAIVNFDVSNALLIFFASNENQVVVMPDCAALIRRDQYYFRSEDLIIQLLYSREL